MNPLEQWLSAATRGLSAESAARVRAEIQQHHELACEAGGDAIAALGDPRAANRAYRKVLLTEQEAMLASAVTQPKRVGFWYALFSPAAVLAFVWWMSSHRLHPPSSGFWPLMIALLGLKPFVELFPVTSLKRSRIRVYVDVGLGVVVAMVGWWFYGWMAAIVLGAVVSGSGYFFSRARLSIFRKLASGQTYSPLPEEPWLTHVEAIRCIRCAARNRGVREWPPRSFFWCLRGNGLVSDDLRADDDMDGCQLRGGQDFAGLHRGTEPMVSYR